MNYKKRYPISQIEWEIAPIADPAEVTLASWRGNFVGRLPTSKIWHRIYLMQTLPHEHRPEMYDISTFCWYRTMLGSVEWREKYATILPDVELRICKNCERYMYGI